MTEKQAVRALLLRIPERIHKKAKKFAKENGVTLTSLINQALAKYIDEPKYTDAADNMLESLIDNYTTKDMPHSNGLLTDGIYNRNEGHNPECTMWGDYFHSEALMRKLNPDWKMYW